jgi:hypothetical protein
LTVSYASAIAFLKPPLKYPFSSNITAQVIVFSTCSNSHHGISHYSRFVSYLISPVLSFRYNIPMKINMRSHF